MTPKRLDFEWDSEKAASNVRKHGIRFEVAVEVFLDTFAIVEEDRFAVEEFREMATGLTGEGVLVVISTQRHDGVTRIISARRASKYERTRYQDSRRVFDD